MPFSIPAYSLYQWQIPAPLKGNWNRPPNEGDRLLNAEIDWLSGTSNTALQFQVGGNSPVALSQIVAIYCDNRRCGSDVTFWFPDTAFELVVPAHTQGLFPVFTNALLFYAIAAAAALGDVTILQVLNSLPPPIALLPATQATAQATVGQPMVTPGTVNTQVVPATVSGTLTGISIHGTMFAGASAGLGIITILDGSTPSPQTLWQRYVQAPTNGADAINVDLTGMAARFFKGLIVQVVTVNGFSTGQVTTNLYYTTP